MTVYNNSINNASPNVVAHSILLSQGAGNQTGLLLTAGEVAIGTTSGDPTGALITGSGNVTVTSSSGAIAVSLTGPASFVWSAAASSPITGIINTGYYVTNASATTIDVPATFQAGATLAVVGQGAGGWILQMNTGQTLHIGNQSTSSGGTLTSSNQYDCIEILCVVANTTFVVRNMMGNIAYA